MTPTENTTPTGARPVDYDHLLLVIGQTVGDLTDRHQALDLGEIKVTPRQRRQEMARLSVQAEALLDAAATFEAHSLDGALVQLRALASLGSAVFDCQGEPTDEQARRFWSLVESITGAVEGAADLDRAYCGGGYFLPCAKTVEG